MITNRYLDALEEQFEPLQLDSHFAVEYRGEVDAQALEGAFRALYMRHPVLRARITHEEDGYLLHVLEGCYPAFTIIDGDENTLIEEVSHDFGVLARKTTKAWNQNRPLARLRLIRGIDSGYVLLTVSHTIVDGAALLALHHELWDIYTAIVNRGDVPVRSGNCLPLSPIELLKERWTNSTTHFSDPRHHALVTCEGVCRILRLSQQETNRLVTSVRAKQISIGTLLLGEALVALRDHESKGKSVSMKVSTIIDLRRHVTPPVGATETTYFCGRHVSTIDVPIEPDLMAIGSEFKGQLSRAIETRSILIAGLSARYLNPLDEADVIYNNVGVVPLVSHPNNLEIIDSFSPRYYRDGSIPLVARMPRFGVASYTYNGRLTVILYTHVALNNVIDRVEQRIADIVRS